MTKPNYKPPSLGAVMLVFGMSAAAICGLPASYVYFHHDKTSKFLENIDNALAPARQKTTPVKSDTVKTYEPN